MVHGSIPLPFRRNRSLRHRRRFPNSNLSPARPLSGTIPAAQSAKTKETESKDEKPLHRRGGAETTCQKSALTFATYCVHPVSDGDREQVKITRREENGTEPGARRSEKGTEKPRRNRLHRTPTSRRIRRRAARTYDRLRFGAGDTTVRQSAALRTESSGAIPAPSGNRAIPGIATGDCQRPSSSASAAIVATP